MLKTNKQALYEISKSLLDVADAINRSHNDITLEDIKLHWHLLINELEKVNPKCSNFLENINAKAFSINTLFIELINGHKFQLKILENDKSMITTVFKNILQKDINISFTIKNEDDK